MSDGKDLKNKSSIQNGNMSNVERPIPFSEIFSTKIMPKIYGFGAAVAIMGAMFKLLSLPGGAFMLGAGLSTEAFIFFISAFEKPAKDYDWSIVFPQLDKDYAFKHGITDEQGVINYNNIPAPFIGQGGMRKNQQVQNIQEDSLTDLLTKCNVDQESLNRLGSGIRNLSIVCSEIGNFSKTTIEWESFSENLNRANVSFEKIAEFGLNINNSLEKIDSEFTKLVDGGMVSQIEVKTVGVNEGLSALSSKITDLNKSYDNVLRALKG